MWKKGQPLDKDTMIAWINARYKPDQCASILLSREWRCVNTRKLMTAAVNAGLGPDNRSVWFRFEDSSLVLRVEEGWPFTIQPAIEQAAQQEAELEAQQEQARAEAQLATQAAVRREAARLAAIEATRIAEEQRAARVLVHINNVKLAIEAHQTAVIQLTTTQQAAQASRTALSQLLAQIHQVQRNRYLAETERQCNEICQDEEQRITKIIQGTDMNRSDQEKIVEQEKIAAKRVTVAQEATRIERAVREVEQKALVAAEQKVTTEQQAVIGKIAEIESKARAVQTAANNYSANTKHQHEKDDAKRRFEEVEGYVKKAIEYHVANEIAVRQTAEARDGVRQAASSELTRLEAARPTELERITKEQHVLGLQRLTAARQTTVTQFTTAQQDAEASHTALTQLLDQNHQAEAVRHEADIARQLEEVRVAEEERLFQVEETAKAHWFEQQIAIAAHILQMIEQVVATREALYPDLNRDQKADVRAQQLETQENIRLQEVERLKIPGGVVRVAQDLVQDKQRGKIMGEQDATRWMANCELEHLTAERQIDLITRCLETLDKEQLIETQQLSKTPEQINRIQEKVAFYETYTPAFKACLAPHLAAAEGRVDAEKEAAQQLIMDKEQGAIDRAAAAEAANRADIAARAAEQAALIAAEQKIVAQQQMVLKHLEEAKRLAREAQTAAEICLKDNLTPAERVEANVRAEAVEGHIQDIQQRGRANEARVTEATKEKEAACADAIEAGITAQQERETVHQQKEHHLIEEYRAEEQVFHETEHNLQEQRIMKEQRLNQEEQKAEKKLFGASKRQELKHFADWKISIGFEQMTAKQQIDWLKLYQQEETVRIGSYTFQPFIDPQASKQDDTEIARRMMLKRLNETCTQQLAAAEKRLAVEKARHSAEQRMMNQGRNVSRRSQPSATASPASNQPRISLELILQCGLDLINSPDILLLDKASSPAMLLLMWDYAAVLSALAPDVSDNKYTLFNEKALFRMQQLCSEPVLFKQSLSRLEQQVHSGSLDMTSTNTTVGSSDTIFNSANPALKSANRVLQYLRDKSKVSGVSFFKRTPGARLKNKAALSQQDRDFATLVTESEKIERQAQRIDPNALSENLRAKMRTRATSLDKQEVTTVQRTMAIWQ